VKRIALVKIMVRANVKVNANAKKNVMKNVKLKMIAVVVVVVKNFAVCLLTLKKTILWSFLVNCLV